jgi:hypothetical protein
MKNKNYIVNSKNLNLKIPAFLLKERAPKLSYDCLIEWGALDLFQLKFIRLRIEVLICLPNSIQYPYGRTAWGSILP